MDGKPQLRVRYNIQVLCAYTVEVVIPTGEMITLLCPFHPIPAYSTQVIIIIRIYRISTQHQMKTHGLVNKINLLHVASLRSSSLKDAFKNI